LMDAGAIDGVLVAKLDRLTRSLRDWTFLITNYFGGDRAKVRLFSVSEEVNTTTATGRMVLNIIMTIAQWELETISERTRKGMREKMELRESCGRVPYGCRLAADGKSLLDDQAEQNAIALMERLRDGGASLRAIGEALQALGIETKDGNPIWTPMTISRILTRRTIIHAGTTPLSA